MENTSFVLQLDTVVDNKNLPIVGELELKYYSEPGDNVSDFGTGYQCVNVTFAKNIQVTVRTVDNYFYSKESPNLGSEIQGYANNLFNRNCFINNKDCSVFISNKYDLKDINFGGFSAKRWSANLNDIKYCTQLATINTPEASWYGDLSVFESLRNITHLDLRGPLLTGDIKSLSGKNLKVLLLTSASITGDLSYLNDCVSIRTLWLSNTQITGTLEDFCTSLFNKGKTSGSIEFGGNSKITYNGSIIGNQQRKTISFNSSGYTVS